VAPKAPAPDNNAAIGIGFPITNGTDYYVLLIMYCNGGLTIRCSYSGLDKERGYTFEFKDIQVTAVQ
jgi:hypothetical protein